MLGNAVMTVGKALIVADENNRIEQDLPECEQWHYKADIINEVENTAHVKITTNDGEVFYM